MPRESEITALLIAPNRELAAQFLGTIPQTRAFQVLADLKSYPPLPTLEIRIRQLRPNVVLLDVASELPPALDLIRAIAALDPPVHVIGLHSRNDSQAVLQSLRAGATEFLYAPFDPAIQKEAVTRLRRLVVPEPVAGPTEGGTVLGFASSKPGSGASTIATQTAFSMQRRTGKRVLLIDCDLTGGTIGFYLKLSHNYSLVDALQHAGHLEPALWNSLTVNYGGVDILPAPPAPFAEPFDPARLKYVAEYARGLYDWVILDLPTVFAGATMMAASECEQAFLVSTTELPSLHLTRKALTLVEKLGFPKDRFQVLVNRVHKRADIGLPDMEKLFGCPVHSSFPNDYFSLHRVVTLGQPLGPEGELGKAIESIASRISGARTADKKGAALQKNLKPAVSQA